MKEITQPSWMADIEARLGGKSGRHDDHDHDVDIDWKLVESGIEIAISGENELDEPARLCGTIEFADREHALEVIRDLTQSAAEVHAERMDFAMCHLDGPQDITHGTEETFGWWVYGFSAEEIARAEKDGGHEIRGSRWHIDGKGHFVEEASAEA